MKNRRVRVAYGRTIQTAAYESLRLDVAIEKDIDDSADLKAETEKSTDGLRSYVENKIQDIVYQKL